MFIFDKIYNFTKANQNEIPVIISSPHSGRHYPKEFLDIINFNNREIRVYEDFMIDKLYEFAPDIGCKLLTNNVPRIIIDLNRSKKEIDKKMFRKFIDQKVEYSRKVSSGIGLFPRYIGYNGIYKDKLDWPIFESLIEEVYDVWHNKLYNEINEMADIYSNLVLLDCHSMSSLDLKGNRNINLPDFVLGDLYNKSCKKEITDFLLFFLKKEGFKVSINEPFAGDYILKKYGKPNKGINALQIEIRKDLYCDERNFILNESFSDIQSMLKRMIINLSYEMGYNKKLEISAE